MENRKLEEERKESLYVCGLIPSTNVDVELIYIINSLNAIESYIVIHDDMQKNFCPSYPLKVRL